MILTTGGRASGATSTRSRPRSFAAAIASSIVNTPSWSPLSAITRTGLIRICRLTRVRGALLLLSGGGGSCAISFRDVKKADPDYPKIRNPSPSGEVSRTLKHSHTRGQRVGPQPTYQVVATKLAEHHLLDKSKTLGLASQATGHDLGVVFEHEQPLLGLRPLVQPPPSLECDEWFQVVAHDPGQRQMRCRRHEIRDKAGLFPAALEQNRLVIGDMSWRRQPADPRKDFRLAVDQVERHALEIVRQIAARGALVRVPGEVQLAFLHDIARLGKRQADLPGGVDPVVAARVIEMEMGVDHPANVFRPMTELVECVLQFGAPAGSRVLDTVDVGELAALLVADPGIDQHQAVVVFDEQAAQGQRDAIAIIGGSAARPERLGDDAEHGAPV